MIVCFEEVIFVVDIGEVGYEVEVVGWYLCYNCLICFFVKVGVQFGFLFLWGNNLQVYFGGDCFQFFDVFFQVGDFDVGVGMGQGGVVGLDQVQFVVFQ